MNLWIHVINAGFDCLEEEFVLDAYVKAVGSIGEKNQEAIEGTLKILGYLKDEALEERRDNFEDIKKIEAANTLEEFRSVGK